MIGGGTDVNTAATMPADLSDEEIDRICRPLTQNAAKVRYLRSLGLVVRRRPDGTPLVSRAHYDAVMSGRVEPASASNGPKWSISA